MSGNLVSLYSHVAREHKSAIRGVSVESNAQKTSVTLLDVVAKE